MSIVVLGVDKLIAVFDAKQLAAELAAQAGVDALGEDVLGSARDRVPVLTGNLRDSLTYSDGRVFTDVVYAGQVEYGGLHNPPEPYLRPAADTANTEGAVAVAKAVFEGA